MKIVSVMTTDAFGGAEFAAADMLDALAGRGHETVMLSDLPGIGDDRNVEVRPLALGPKLSRRSWLSLLLRWPLLVWRLRMALQREAPYDVLLVHYKKEQLLTLTLPRRLRATTIWAEWGPVPFPLRHGLARRIYLAAARRADAVMAVSAGTKRSLHEIGLPEELVEVVPNALRTDEVDFSAKGRARVRADLGIGAEDFVVGCLSRFHPKKRNDVVIEAVKLLNGASAHLILAGDGETEAALRRLAVPLGDRAHFLRTPRGVAGEVLSACDVSVFCPSPTEGAPRAVIMAMLARRPCVSTGAEGVSDLITPQFGAIATREHDAAALAELLQGYIADPTLGPRQGEAGRAWAERIYAGPAVAEQIERMIAAARARR